MFYHFSELDVVDSLRMNLAGFVVVMCCKYCFIRTLFDLGRSAYCFFLKSRATFYKRRAAVFTFQIKGVFPMMY